MIGKIFKYFLLFIFLLTVTGNIITAQKKYWVFFKDKSAEKSHNKDYYDIPVNPGYIFEIQKIAKKIEFESKWLNAVVIKSNKKNLNRLKDLSFIQSIKPVYSWDVSTCTTKPSDTLSLDEKILLSKQTSLLKGDAFTLHNINGKGIRIAVFDGGFSGVDKSPIFSHLFEHNQIIKTFDFVKKKEFVYAYMTHGTKVLSCIAGIYNDQPLGLATGAEYLLARTEIRPERHIEEHYWVEAMEWAAENDANIISCSLGYTSKLYPMEAMDGKTSIVAKAAAIAARKGILVINSMGNDGSDKWEIMGTPADADSVLSIGGINPFTGYHISFSSYGPTFDNRMKPNVSASGAVMAWSGKGIGKSFGTSFSAPLISGYAACVWQIYKDSSNMQIFNMIEKSAHLYPYYDYAHGYGIPQADYFFHKKDEIINPPYQIQTKNDTLKVIVNDLKTDPFIPADLLYYHIEDTNGTLRYYAVIKVEQPDVLNIALSSVKDGETVRFYYKNYIQQYIKK